MRIINHILFLLCIHFTAAAQMTPNAISQNSFLGNDISNTIDEYFIQNPDKQFHSSLKPFNYVTLNKLNDDKINYKHLGIHNYLMTIHSSDSSKSKNKIRFQVLPQLNVEQGKDLLTNKWTNSTSGGLYLKIEGNKKFTAAATYIGGYITAPNFNDTTIQEHGIVPGMGIAYPNNFIGNGTVVSPKSQLKYSYQNFSGYLSYSPRNFINLQVGKDKHFVGDGYRSLLLSDVANNYPYFKTSFNIWKLQYSVWYSWFNNIQDANGMKKDFKNKYGTFHYLSWNATKNINFSIFENVIFQGTDTTRTRGFDPNYLNPVIFYRPVEYSLGSSDNSMLGFNFKATIAKSLKLYGQVVLDEFYLKEIRAKNGWWANKQGIQIGAKYINAFTIKKLTLQAEYNLVRPYTYSHGSPDQSYTHFNQSLAHPFGANFKEAIGIVSYKHYRYRLEGKFIYAEMGRDSLGNSNVGQNIFLSYTTRPKEYGHYTGQGVKTTFMQAELKYTYYLIADWNLRIEAGFIQRIYQNERGFDKQTPFVYAGIKTNLYNSYKDF